MCPALPLWVCVWVCCVLCAHCVGASLVSFWRFYFYFFFIHSFFLLSANLFSMDFSCSDTSRRTSIVDLLLTAAWMLQWMCLPLFCSLSSAFVGGKDTVVDFAMPLIEPWTFHMFAVVLDAGISVSMGECVYVYWRTVYVKCIITHHDSCDKMNRFLVLLSKWFITRRVASLRLLRSQWFLDWDDSEENSIANGHRLRRCQCVLLASGEIAALLRSNFSRKTVTAFKRIQI